MRNIEVANIPVVGAIVAACSIYVVQWMWWGAVWNDTWPELNRVTEADLAVPYVWWFGGLVVIAVQVVGIGALLQMMGWPSLAEATGRVAGLGALLAVPMLGYHLVYLPAHSWTLFAIDAASIMMGWLISAVTLTLLKQPARADVAGEVSLGRNEVVGRLGVE